MGDCPYSKDHQIENLRNAENDLAVGYCQKCFETVFKCPKCGNWNRAFARFCTQCGPKQVLQKPDNWVMAGANENRTGLLRHKKKDHLNSGYGFTSWSTTVINNTNDLPSLLAFDGLILVPNAEKNCMDAYSIARPVMVKWSIGFNESPTYASTSVYYGLHLYYVVQGGLIKASVFGDDTKQIELDIDASKIKPVPGCAPLLFDYKGAKMLVVALQEGILIYRIERDVSDYVVYGFSSDGNTPRTPVICDDQIVMTTQKGKIFHLNLARRKKRLIPCNYLSFSAPVSISGKVYFEAIDNNKGRNIVCYHPQDGKISQTTPLNEQVNLDEHQAFLRHPPLTDGERLFLSDRFGKKVYRYDDGMLQTYTLSNDSRLRLAPHQSIVVGNQIYSATASGLTVFNLQRGSQYRTLAVGRSDNPAPISKPIRYGDKLFFLCKNRLVCTSGSSHDEEFVSSDTRLTVKSQ